MKPSTVRLTPLSAITRRPVEAIRNIQKSKDAPWYDEGFHDGAQRRYTGYEALALVLAESLMAQGCNVALAGEFVRAHQKAIDLFLDEVEGAHSITPRFVFALQMAIEDDWTGPNWIPTILLGTGTSDEVQDCYVMALNSVGRVRPTRDGRTTQRVIGGPWTATVSIPESYRLLRLRAKAAGYLVDGRSIFKISDEAE
jgi:hypothetical protein